MNMNALVDTPQAELFIPVARIYGEAMQHLPQDLYIPPDALEIMLDAFEGPLDLLLYLIRKANVDILDIPMAPLTRQYLDYIDSMQASNLELAAEYLVMAAMLIEIKSRMLLPRTKVGEGDEADDPRAGCVGGGPEGGLGCHLPSGKTEQESQNQSRRVVGTRTYGHHPASFAGARRFCPV